MKKYISGLITGIIISLSLTAFAAVELNVISNPYSVLINGDKSQVDGYNINGSTYLKLRDFEKAGLKVDFQNNNILITSSNTQKIENKSEVSSMQAKTTYKIFINNKEFNCDVPPMNYNSEIYCPVVNVKNLVQANYNWDSQNYIFTLTKGNISIAFKEGTDLIKTNGRYFIPLKKAVEAFGGTYLINENNVIITMDN